MRVLVLAALAFASACGKAQSDKSGASSETAPVETAEASAKRWFISAANPYATDAGAAILARGGSAVDAAIATHAVLGLVEPQSSGLGGGAFMIHFDPATGVLETYDGREVAPASATPERFLKDDGEPMDFYDAVASGLSIGVPGAVRMLDRAHGEHGVLPWADLLEPAEDLATEGFKVSPRLNGLLDRFVRVKTMPVAANYFYDPNGAPHPVGHVLKNAAYAKTISTLRQDGAEAFYAGEIAQGIVDAVNSAPNPGGMTLGDLADYQPIKRDAVCAVYRAHEICSMAPPSSGGVTTLQILAMLEPFDMRAAGAGSIEALHLMFEASKLAFADRRKYLADRDQSSEDGGLTQDELIAGLLNPAYLEARSALIDKQTAALDVDAGDPSQYQIAADAGKWRGLAPDASPDLPGTSHFVIVDSEGRVVSMTATVEFAFGSHQMVGGFILNNQLTDFSFVPVRDGAPVANAVAPGKRPRSSMAPVIAFDENGRLKAALGSPGGPAIIGYVAKTLIALIDWDLSMQAAIDQPNAVHPRDQAILETGGFDDQIKAGLTARGHLLVERDLTSGIHGFVVTPDGEFDGGADKRREGVWKTGTVTQ